jgi:hypothetical protein
MKINISIATAGFLLFSLLNASCKNNAKANDPTTKTEDVPIETVVAQGKYLVGILGCNDCHSPKKMGPNGPEIIPELMLSGYPADRPVVTFDNILIQQGFGIFYPDLTAAAGPWGVSFAGNLTPDDTGIGNWTEGQFKKALKEGKYKGLDNGRMLLPPMPWTNFANIKDEDLHAIFTYLKSIPAVENTCPPPISPAKII